MKREIKFRGKRVDNNEWIIGNLLDNGITKFFILSENAYNFDEYETVISQSIGQFTGFKDKNGVNIYEGDIVIYNRGVGNWTGERMSTTHEIVFNDEVFAFVLNYGNSYIKLRKHWNYIYEVIGNIYENQELLKP